MKYIYWLKTDQLYFFPAGEPIPKDAWESIEVTDEESPMSNHSAARTI